MRTSAPLLADLPGALDRLRPATRVLVALDYDGTIAPIVSAPEQARTSPEMDATLCALAAVPVYSLAVISGRSLADLRQRLRIPATYVGNHGLEIEGPGISFVHRQAPLARDTLDQACWDLEAALLSIPGVRVERKGFTATVHYRNAPADLESWIRQTVELKIGPYRRGLRTAEALKAVEIRPRLDWHKGAAVRLLLDRLETMRPGLVCIGDDRTDEDMFGLLPSEISVRVGHAPQTRARYRARDVADVLTFLKALAGRAADATPPMTLSA